MDKLEMVKSYLQDFKVMGYTQEELENNGGNCFINYASVVANLIQPQLQCIRELEHYIHCGTEHQKGFVLGFLCCAPYCVFEEYIECSSPKDYLTNIHILKRNVNNSPNLMKACLGVVGKSW